MSAAHRAGFVALAGLPNAGKSTLLNALLRFKLSIVSSKPQTTRHRLLGILEGEGFQICLLDTPGLIAEPADPLQKSLRAQAGRALREDADLVVYLIDAATAKLGALEAPPLRAGVPLLLVLNKCDRPEAGPKLDALEAAYAAALRPARVFRLSALKGAGVEALKEEIVSRLPKGPPFYEKGQLSDRWERFFAAEIVREQVFELYREEIPHAVAALVDSFRERPGRPDEIFATLYVERDGQKGILLGKGGRDLRRLRERSQARLESFLNRKVSLELRVKLRKDWRRDPRSLREFGY